MKGKRLFLETGGSLADLVGEHQRLACVCLVLTDAVSRHQGLAEDLRRDLLKILHSAIKLLLLCGLCLRQADDLFESLTELLYSGSCFSDGNLSFGISLELVLERFKFGTQHTDVGDCCLSCLKVL